MAFVLPTFNLVCNIWHDTTWAATIPPVNPPDLSPQCNLALGRREAQTFTSVQGQMWLLLPALTDVRWTDVAGTTISPDLVEVPAGSGRYYIVVGVDDIGKGFANEHRFALLNGSFPIPVPLP